MTREMETAIERLKALPEEAQGRLGERLNQYLNQLDELQALIQEGVDSGPAEPLDMEAIKREARAEWQASRTQ